MGALLSAFFDLFDWEEEEETVVSVNGYDYLGGTKPMTEVFVEPPVPVSTTTVVPGGKDDEDEVNESYVTDKELGMYDYATHPAGEIVNEKQVVVEESEESEESEEEIEKVLTDEQFTDILEDVETHMEPFRTNPRAIELLMPQIRRLKLADYRSQREQTAGWKERSSEFLSVMEEYYRLRAQYGID